METRRYILASMLQSSKRIDISKGDYDALVKAVDCLLHRTDAEEIFDSIIENYLEFEEYILREALRSMVSRRRHDNISWQEPRNTTARRLSNFLSSTRLYITTIETHAAAIVGDQAGGDQIKSAIRGQFESSQSYRIMDALRNYAQHAALAVHSFTISMSRTPDLEFSDHRFEPAVKVAALAADKQFKRETLKEIENGPPSLELKPMVREYVESLSKIHHGFRELTDGRVDQFSAIIREAEKRLLNALPDSRPEIGLVVFEADADARHVGKETDATKSLTEYLDFMRRKNQYLGGLPRRRIQY
jgi:hypothetical protein